MYLYIHTYIAYLYVCVACVTWPLSSSYLQGDLIVEVQCVIETVTKFVLFSKNRNIEISASDRWAFGGHSKLQLRSTPLDFKKALGCIRVITQGWSC